MRCIGKIDCLDRRYPRDGSLATSERQIEILFGRVISAWRAARSKRTGHMAQGQRIDEFGGRVIYALDELKAWADLAVRASTSDPVKALLLPAKNRPRLRPMHARSHGDRRMRIATMQD